MAHIRTLLRNSLITAITGLATTGARVYTPSKYPNLESEIPGLMVDVADTATSDSLATPTLQMRTFEITITALVRSTSDADALLNQIGLEVETALAGGITVAGRALVLDYTGSTPDFSADGDQPIAQLRIGFSAIGTTFANTPSTLG
jgi:hypothetical protein